MNYATFAALTNYDTLTAALAASANAVDGSAWLVNETKIVDDGRFPDSGPASTQYSNQIQKAKTLSLTIQRNKISAAYTGSLGPTGTLRNISNKEAGYANTSKGGGTWENRVTRANVKGPAIRQKVAWYVTDSTQSVGYRRVFGILEQPGTTVAGRDDDAQVRK
jgi:hypothetical protein